MKVIKILFLLLISLTFVFGEETKKKKKEEEKYGYDHQEIVVTAKKPAITDISTVQEVGENVIKKVGATNVVEALEVLPGVIYTTGRRGEPILQIRGFDQRQLVVMVDGVPIYVPYDGQVDLSQLPIEGVAKIKVIKGTSSTIYGPNSMGGIINIITKAPDEKLKTTVSFDFGRNLNRKAALSVGKKSGRFGFWISGEYDKSDGFYLSDKYKLKINEDGNLRENSYFEKKGLKARFDYFLNESDSLFFYIGYIDNEKGVPPHTYEGRPRYWRFTTWRKGTFKISGKKELFDRLELRGSLFYDLYYNVLDSYDDATYSTQTRRYAFHSTYDDYSIGANLLGDYTQNINHLRFGINLKKDIHRSQGDFNKPWETYEAFTYSLGLENELSPTKNLSFVLGTSFDYLKPLYANGGELRSSIFVFNPLIGVLFRKNLSKFHLSFSKKTRFPTLKEFYSEYIGRNIPNPDLKEEKSFNYEAGFKQVLSAEGNVEISLFYSDLTDLIVRKRIGKSETGSSLYQMQNIARARYVGAEFSFNYIFFTGYDVNFSYTYLNAKNLSPDRKSDKLEYKPDHKLSLISGFKLPLSLRGIIKSTYISKRYFEDGNRDYKPLNPFTLVDMKIEKDFGAFNLYLMLRNVLDTNYESEAGFPGAGREYIAGIRWKIL